MFCASCGAPQAAGARFCAACGERLGGGDPAAVVAEVPRRNAPLSSDGATIVCPHCCRRTRPRPYFSRGVNIAKAAVLLVPLNVVGPLAFFFWRRDRFVCAECQGMLPLEASVSLLHAFSAETSIPVQGRPGQRPSETELTAAEVTYLQRKSRQGRAKTGVMLVLAGLLGGGAAAAVEEDEEELAAALAGFGSVAAVGGAVAGASSRKRRQLAEAKRDRLDTLRLIDLAHQNKGRLTVTYVAAQLSCDFQEAERLLDRLVDGRRVDMQVDADGRVTYVFPELLT